MLVRLSLRLPLLLADQVNYVKDQAEDYYPEDSRSDPNDLIRLIVFLGKTFARGIEPARPALLQLVQAHATLHHHGLIHFLRWCRGWSLSFQAHLNLAQA